MDQDNAIDVLSVNRYRIADKTLGHRPAMHVSSLEGSQADTDMLVARVNLEGLASIFTQLLIVSRPVVRTWDEENRIGPVTHPRAEVTTYKSLKFEAIKIAGDECIGQLGIPKKQVIGKNGKGMKIGCGKTLTGDEKKWLRLRVYGDSVPN